MTGRHIVWFCPCCGLQTPDKSTTNDCCPKNRVRVYADSIEAQRMGPWKFETAKEEDIMGETQTNSAELKKKRGHPQTEIPGAERIQHKDIRKVAQELYELRIQRIEIQKQEEPLHVKLIALMKKHDVTHCEEGDLELTLTTVEEKVKIRRKKSAASDIED